MNLSLPNYINFNDLFKVKNRIEFFIQQKKYTLRNLINIYYDINCSNNNFNILTDEILKILKENTQDLTQFLILLFLKGAAFNKNQLRIKDHKIINILLKKFLVNSNEYDLTQKCNIFKYICELEFYYFNEKRIFPLELIQIYNKIKVEDLCENNILNLALAQMHLPKNFKINLISNIHESIFQAISKKTNTYNDIFLLKYFERYLNIVKKRNLKFFYRPFFENELANKLDNFVFFSQISNITKVISIFYDSNNQLILKKMQNILDYYLKNNLNCLFILEFLSHHQINISEYLEKVIIFNYKVIYLNIYIAPKKFI